MVRVGASRVYAYQGNQNHFTNVLHFIKTVLLFLSLTFISLPALAHLGNLSGTVYDRATNLPLRGVNVRLSELGRATLTNELGQYRFDELVPASYTVELSHVGFGAQTVVVLVQDDQTTLVKTALSNAPVQLSEVLVSSQRAHDQQLISSLDIKLRPITNSQEILRMVPGLFIGQHAGGGKSEQIFLRGRFGGPIRPRPRHRHPPDGRRDTGQHGIARARAGLRRSALRDSGDGRRRRFQERAVPRRERKPGDGGLDGRPLPWISERARRWTKVS